MFSRRNMLLLRACQVLPLEASPCRHSKVDVHEAARPFSEGRPRGPHSRLRRGAQGASQASGGNGRTTASAPVVAAFARDVDQHMRTRLAGAPPSRSAKRTFRRRGHVRSHGARRLAERRSEEYTSELQSHSDLVCRLLLEKKKQKC